MAKQTTTDKIQKLFDSLTPTEQQICLTLLSQNKKTIKVNTKNISKFAVAHQAKYKKDIAFTVSQDGLVVTAELTTAFGKFTGTGSNQKVAKLAAIKMAEEKQK